MSLTKNKKTQHKRRQRHYDESTPSMTQQHLTSEVSIKNIMARYLKTGFMPPQKTEQYGDVSNIDFQDQMFDAKRKISSLTQAFNNLPLALQQKFGMDPVAYVQYLSDTRNHKEAYELGLITEDLTASLPNPLPSQPPKPDPVQTEIPGTEKK